ncbi:MAG: protein kinase [Polyangiaceae bacterium]
MARSEGLTEDASVARDEDLVGRTIGKYTLTRLIGKGGMGVVYEAQNTAINKRVAIKLVSSELARNKDAVRRFQREAQAAGSVESAHIVHIFDAGSTDDGVPYIVMELLRGEDLGHRIKRLGRLELDDALHITVQILRGLTRAHAAGIVHRDLKPDNIFLVDRDDDPTFVKVLDFGISKVAPRGETPVQTLTKQGTVLGTPFYMSPEQAQGFADTDGRADLWSVGAILYECLTGRAPHTGGSYEQVIVNICTKDADDVRLHNPAVPEAIAKTIARALARERDDRFPTARDMLEGVAASSGGTISLPPRSSDEPSIPSGGVRSGPRSGSGPHSSPGSSPSGERGRPLSGDAFKAVSGDGPRISGGAFEDTVEVLKSGGVSRVGWSTSGGPAAGRDRRRAVLIGVGVLALSGAAAAAFFSRGPADPPPAPAEPLRDDVTVRLRANVRNARFLVDGKQLAGGLLRGPRGSTRTVLVEADGYAPVEALVALEAGQEPPEVHLSEKLPSPETSTAPVAVAATSADPGGAATGGPPQDSFAPRSNGRVAPPQPTSAPTGKPATTSTSTSTQTVSSPPTATTAPPATTPTLTLKRD